MECITAIATIVMAMATIAMAVFTYYLWCSTEKLWKETKNSIQLGREEFIAAHPPKLRIHNIDFKESCVMDTKSQITFDIVNIGGNTAHVIERNITFAKLNPLPNTPPYSSNYPDLSRSISLERGRGSGECLPVDDEIIMNHIRGLRMMGKVDESDCYLFGYIDYYDDFNFSGRSAFCRRYNVKTRRFTKVEDEHYEYNSY